MKFSQMNNEWKQGDAEYMGEDVSRPSFGFFMHIRGDD